MDSEILKEKLIQYLEEHDLKYIEREGKISHQCVNPEHQENSPSAFTIFGEQPFSHCSSCGFHLNTEKLYNFLDVGIDPDMLFNSQIKGLLKSLDKSEDKKSAPMFLPIESGKFDKNYRGISISTFQKVGAFYTIEGTYYQKRIIIPIRDIDRNLKGFEAVSTNKNIVPKILRPKLCDTSELLGFEEYIDSDTLFITEGIFSALSFVECNYNAVFNFGVGSIKPKIKKLLMRGVKNVIIASDNDTTGDKFYQECYKSLRNSFRVIRFFYPYEFKNNNKFDPNDLLKNYGKERFIQYVNKFLSKNLIF